jgi:hypothetical protein
MPFVILPTNSASGGYDITNSLRFNSGSSDYLNRTPSSSGNRQIWTFSFWIKKTALASRQNFFQGGNHDAGSNSSYMEFSSGNVLRIAEYNGSIETYNLDTTQLFRDVSAFYHIVVAFDTTQATSTNRVKLYVNGTQVTSFSTSNYPTQNYNTSVNHTLVHNIGRDPAGGYAFNGYMSDVYLIDGQQLTPSSFGETDFDTGIWKPKAYTGSFGTNGFYLQFKNSAALGTDSSGNGNTFTANNLTSVDQSTDTPTNNFCTMNPLDNYWQSSTFTEGNLQVQTSNTPYSPNYATIGVSKGKWYWEVKVTAQSSSGVLPMIGVASTQCTSASQELGYSANDYGFATFSGNIRTNSTNNSYGNAISLGDIVGVALDLDNNTIKFYINGTVQNSGTAYSITASSSTVLGNYFPAYGDYSSSNNTTAQFNFGNPPYTANGYTDGAGYGNFSYSVPSGFYSLNTKNLAQFG